MRNWSEVCQKNSKNRYKYCSMCTDFDCPFTKFIKNKGKLNVQKQCLLNYINRLLINGLKLFPNNFSFLIF